MTETLTAVIAAPERVAEEVPDSDLQRLLVEVTVLQGRLATVSELLLLRLVKRPESPEVAERLLHVDEAAAMLGVDERWIRRRARTLPFVRRLSGKAIRVSEDSLKRWVAARKTA